MIYKLLTYPNECYSSQQHIHRIPRCVDTSASTRGVQPHIPMYVNIKHAHTREYNVAFGSRSYCMQHFSCERTPRRRELVPRQFSRVLLSITIGIGRSGLLDATTVFTTEGPPPSVPHLLPTSHPVRIERSLGQVKSGRAESGDPRDRGSPADRCSA